MTTGTKRIASSAAVIGAAILVGACPLPQPLPGVGSTDAGVTITPPRVSPSTAQPSLPVTRYAPAAACDGGAEFSVVADVIDLNVSEPDEVRWFVDYDPAVPGIPGMLIFSDETLLGSSDPTAYKRTPTPVIFHPSAYDSLTTSGTHVLQMAVSNGFQAPTTEPSSDGGTPNMEPTAGYEVQVFRWTFELAADGGCGP